MVAAEAGQSVAQAVVIYGSLAPAEGPATSVSPKSPGSEARRVADLLKLHIDYVRRKFCEGVIPCHRLPGGRAFRYFRGRGPRLAALLARRRRQPAGGELDRIPGPGG